MKVFPLSSILTVVTDRCLTDGGMGPAQELVEYMVGQSVFTHQLPMLHDPVKNALLRQFPEFAGLQTEIDEICDKEPRDPAEIDAWLFAQEQKFGSEQTVFTVEEMKRGQGTSDSETH